MRRNLRNSLLLAQLNIAKFIKGIDGEEQADTLFAGVSAEHNLMTALQIVHNAIVRKVSEHSEIDIDAYYSGISIKNLTLQELVAQIRVKEDVKITFSHNEYGSYIIHFEGGKLRYAITAISKWAEERGFWVELASYKNQDGQVVIDITIDNPGDSIELNKTYELRNPYF